MARNPSDNGNTLVGVSIALSVLQIGLVAARFYTRRLQRERYGWDDWVMLIALAGSLAKAVIYIVMVKVGGLGYHLSDPHHPAQIPILIKKGFWVVELLDFPLTITPAKISLLLFYVRIFCTPKFRVFAYLVGSLVLGLGIAMFFQTIFHCSPIDYSWDKTSVHGTCIDQMSVYRIVSPINVLTGVLILVMPMPLVWGLHAPKGQKLALTGVFMLGGLGAVVSIRWVVLYFEYSNPKQYVIWFSVKLSILAVAEGAILIITPCLVSIWPLLTRMVPRRLLGKLSCYPRARQHRCWYETTQMHSNSRCGDTRTRRDSLLTISPSLADLEEQRWWVSDDGVSTPRSCEEVIVDYNSKEY